MHRFFAPADQWSKERVSLDASESRHALQILRLGTGDRVVVLDGAGRESWCVIQAVSKKQVTLEVQQTNHLPPLPCQVTLVQAVPKGKAMEAIIQKATELGASRIIPVMSERTVSQVDAESAAQKMGRWRQVAIEAIKQSGQAWLPRVEEPVPIKQFLQRSENAELSLIASLQAGSRHPRECFELFRSEKKRGPRTLSIWVGPEGDFTPAETASVISAGALPITLGHLVLRCETAAIYCLSVIHYEWQR